MIIFEFQKPIHIPFHQNTQIINKNEVEKVSIFGNIQCKIFQKRKPIFLPLNSQIITQNNMEESRNENKEDSKPPRHLTPTREQGMFPKCLSKSRIKVMQGKIFWNKVQAESSLQRIMVKEKQQSPRIYNEHKQNSMKKQKQLHNLVQKLCLPRIKQCTSLHQTKPMSKASMDELKALQARQNQLDQSKLVASKATNSPIQESHVIKSQPLKQNKGRGIVDQILQNYNRRCKQEIQEFSFNSIDLNRKQKPERQSQFYGESKKPRKSVQSHHISEDEYNTYLPKKILDSLIKPIR